MGRAAGAKLGAFVATHGKGGPPPDKSRTLYMYARAGSRVETRDSQASKCVRYACRLRSLDSLQDMRRHVRHCKGTTTRQVGKESGAQACKLCSAKVLGPMSHAFNSHRSDQGRLIREKIAGRDLLSGPVMQVGGIACQLEAGPTGKRMRVKSGGLFLELPRPVYGVAHERPRAGGVRHLAPIVLAVQNGAA
eukprot:g6582.t1